MARKIMIICGVLLVIVGTVWAVAAATDAKGYLGVYPAEVTSDIAADYGVQPGAGVIIDRVSTGSPADSAGLRANDVIVRVNGTTVTGPEEFRNQISKFKPGEVVDLTYMRGGKEKTAKVKLGNHEERSFNFWPFQGERNHTFRMEGPPWQWGESESSEKSAYAGIVTQSVSEGLAKYFKVDHGALISEVMKGSPADQAGLKPGDVIVKIGSEKIEDEGDVRHEIRNHNAGDAVDFVIMRDGQEQTIKVTLGEHHAGNETGHHIIKFGDEGGPEGMVVLPDEKDMQKLEESLKDLEIHLDSLPDIHWDSLKNQIDIPRMKIEIEKLKPVGQRVNERVRESLEKARDAIERRTVEFQIRMHEARARMMKAKMQAARRETV